MAETTSNTTRPEDVPILAPGHSFRTVTEKISDVVLGGSQPRAWWIGFAIAFGLLQLLLISIGYLFYEGVGIWGINVPVGWAFAIINLVWWIGIGHAGTLISAILLLFRQEWRTSINRFAEAMTLFALACAGLFPIVHAGRPWVAYWLLPYPNTMQMWPNFRSPLVWDVFAISTYTLVSLLFWYVGLIPDLATLRDRTTSKVRAKIYGLFAMGWRGSARHWNRYETMYLLLAGLSTPLVLSVHTIVSFDFAIGIVPGWHATVFPPYFVAGAIYAGFAMVLTIAIPLRKVYAMEDFITMRHIDLMAQVMLWTGLFVAYGYAVEVFMAWYSASIFELALLDTRFIGPYSPLYWSLIFFNVLVTQSLWLSRVRSNTVILFFVAMSVNIGMWLERFVIIVMSLHRDFLPSSWDSYTPTMWDYSTFIGSLGLFATLLFLFIRFVPMISIFEMRTMVPEAKLKEGHHQ